MLSHVRLFATSPPGSSDHGVLQARMLEWGAIPFSRGSSRPRDQSWVSRIAGRFFTARATREVLMWWIKLLDPECVASWISGIKPLDHDVTIKCCCYRNPTYYVLCALLDLICWELGAERYWFVVFLSWLHKMNLKYLLFLYPLKEFLYCSYSFFLDCSEEFTSEGIWTCSSFVKKSTSLKEASILAFQWFIFLVGGFKWSVYF